MKPTVLLCVLAAVAASGMPTAQAATPAGDPAVVRLSCRDYLALNEAQKPQFITAARDTVRKVTSIIVDKLGVEERIKPELDRYCRLNPDQSAYEHLRQSNTAPEKTRQ